MTSTSSDRLNGARSSLAIKAPVLVATTANITLSGEQTIDGVAVVTGNRVLVKDQASGVNNGIYIADTGDWSRAPDFDGNNDITFGTIVLVTSGTTNSNSYWRVSTSTTITVGTTSITFARAVVNDSSLLDFLQAGTGAVARSVQSKERDIISVRDFGAVGDGATNDAAAIQLALNAAYTLGSDCEVPPTLNGYYMGTTGITVNGGVGLQGGGATRLIWDAAFTGTAITLTGTGGGYSKVRNLNIYMPKSVAAPNASIIGIDIQTVLSIIENVVIDQTSAGNNSPWYTGIKLSGTNNLTNTIRDCHIYAYNRAIYSTGHTLQVDMTIENTEATAQVTAVVDVGSMGVLNIIGCDLEAVGATYVVHMTTSGSAVAFGGGIFGSWLLGNDASTTEVIYLEGNVTKAVQGFAIQGNGIENSLGTTSIRLKYTAGVSISGNYLNPATNYLNLDTSNTEYSIQGNFTNAKAVTQSGTTEGLNYLTGTWTPAIGGTATYTLQTGEYVKVGKKVTVRCTLIVNAIGTGSATRITGLPFNAVTGKSFGAGVEFFSGLALTPTYLAAQVTAGYIEFHGLTAAAAAMTATMAILQNAARVDFTITYFTDSF